MKHCASWLVLLLLGATASAAPESFDWPQWQGVDRTSVSKEHGLLQEWRKDGPPLVWEVKDVGGGYGAPAVAAGRIFGMGARGEDQVAWALSEKDGKAIWVTKLQPLPSQSQPQGKEGPACTPTVDGDLLYIIGNGGDIACLQVSDGKIVWQRSMAHDFGGHMPTWAYQWANRQMEVHRHLSRDFSRPDITTRYRSSGAAAHQQVSFRS